MAETVDELTVDYMEDGKLVSRQLDKVVLSKGAWSTILYKYQDWDRKNEVYGKVKFSIRRYQSETQWSVHAKIQVQYLQRRSGKKPHRHATGVDRQGRRGGSRAGLSVHATASLSGMQRWPGLTLDYYHFMIFLAGCIIS